MTSRRHQAELDRLNATIAGMQASLSACAARGADLTARLAAAQVIIDLDTKTIADLRSELAAARSMNE